MEKIIELLNEAIRNGLDFQGYDILKIEYYSETDIRAYYDKTARAYYNITYEDIISKRAGFIKWLVENDKIDRKKIEKNQTYQLCLGLLIDRGYYVNVLLMLLSISDTPIEDLISYLK